MSVRLAEWVQRLEEEYLEEFVAVGGSAVKLAVAPPEDIEAVLRQVHQAARDRGHLTARVDAAQTRVHMIEQVFFAVSWQVDWHELADRWLRANLRANGIAIGDGQPIDDLDGVGDSTVTPSPRACSTR